MANSYISPNMGLTIPSVGIDPGPDWANGNNASLTVLDGHTHAPGSGVPITPSGLNISADLSFLSNNAIALRTSRYTPQASPISASGADLGCTYVAGADLYYNDRNGNQVQITSGGNVAGSPGSIANLTSPASASFVAATGTFLWQQASSTAANMDFASIVLRYPGSYPSPTGNFIQIQAPSSLSSGFAITLPAALPGSTLPMLISSGGVISPAAITASQISASANIVGTQLSASAGILGSQLSASANIDGSQLDPTAGITGAQIASHTIQQGNLAVRAAGSTVGAGGVASSSSCGSVTTTSGTFSSVTNFSIQITTTGSPVQIMVVDDGSGSGSGIRAFGTAVTAAAQFAFFRNSTQLSDQVLSASATGAMSSISVPVGALSFIDFPAAGTHVYTLQISTGGVSGQTAGIQFAIMVAYEL